jgi:hypothetical protein
MLKHLLTNSSIRINLLSDNRDRRRWSPSLRRGLPLQILIRRLSLDGRYPLLHRSAQPKSQALQMTKSADQILASVKRFCHKAQQTLCAEL